VAALHGTPSAPEGRGAAAAAEQPGAGGAAAAAAAAAAAMQADGAASGGQQQGVAALHGALPRRRDWEPRQQQSSQVRAVQ
jgi:hypothetical protein